MAKKQKRIGSIKKHLLAKSKEAMLTAVQIFNTPRMQFKSESFLVLIVIAWTYLLHAYYKYKKIKYTYPRKKRREPIKYWDLKECLDQAEESIDEATKSNIEYLIGLRNEVAH